MRSTTGGSARSNLLRQRCVAPTCCSSHAHGRKRAGHENKLRKDRGAARGKREGKNRGETEALSESSLIRGRRDSLLVTGTTATSVVLASWAEQLFGEVPLAQAIAEKPVEVSNYLPASSTGIAGFYEFVPGDRETPAIRAGTIGKYRFSMPGSWIRRTVANILSGNYCQPRCDEPWTEVLFTAPKEGSLQVIVSPLNKLSRQPLQEGESIDKVGTLDGIINALGPNITGNTIEEEEVVGKEAKTIDGVTYYWYTLDTPYAKTGQRQVASIAAKDNAVFVLAVSCSEKQWNTAGDKLRTIAESFRI